MNWLALPLTLLLFADADVPRVNSFRPPASPSPSFPADDEIPLFPNGGATPDNTQSGSQPQSKATPPPKNSNATLQERSKLTLIRYVSGEFAKAVKALPEGKDSYYVTLRKPLETGMRPRVIAKPRSAVQWFDTLRPEMKKAIQDRRPVVGMDREELIAAIGKPDHNFFFKQKTAYDIEDWIYGQPPSKTVFVRFQGDRVTSIKQFPQ